MHPLFSRPRQLAGLLALAAGFGLLLAMLLETVSPGGFAPAVAFGVPMALALAFQSLASWYPVRRLAAQSGRGTRVQSLRLVLVGAVSVALWCGLCALWALLLDGLGLAPDLPGRVFAVLPLLAPLGLLLFVLATLAHLVLAALERSRAAERQSLELQVLAREAELRALQAQLDPHFLFNSLNSVAALIGTDSAAARRMCFLMSGFFRKSLGLARREAIPLAEEVYLAETYLAIEEVRFGNRLRARFDVAENAQTLAVPPLLLQPLVENAVHHGVAHLLEGGEVSLRARRSGDRLELMVENGCDPERPASRGAGVGLANVRARLDAQYGHRARLDVESTAGHFRVSLVLPARAAGS